jgi:hypothetical protein
VWALLLGVIVVLALVLLYLHFHAPVIQGQTAAKLISDGDNRVAVHACPYLVLRHRTPSQVLVDPNNSFLAQWDFAPLCMRMRRGSAGD